MKKILLFLLIISKIAYAQTIIEKPQHDVPLVVNEYTEVLAFNICTNEITVANATLYNTGDTVLMIQMKGAVIDTSNTSAFGSIINYKNAGNYEMNYISAKVGNIITLKNKLTRQYDIPEGAVQLIRVPYFKTTNYTGEFTCIAWDGGRGGVLVLNAQTITLGDDIEVSGKGFRRGELGVGISYTNCFENSYVLPASNGNSVFKGESIATVSQNMVKGKASLASGGGAGLSVKSGGGGGANAGTGGFGGYQSDTCGSAPYDNRGMGGRSLAYSTLANKIFMGGGAGAGHAQDIGIPTPLEGTGGGIAIIIADQITSATNKIVSNGGDGVTCSVANCNEGMVGGGGGGTVLLYVNQILDDLQVETKGGKGASVSAVITPGGRVGPGGGGGGGVFFLNRPSLPANITSVNTSGDVNGVIYTDANNPWGATSGTGGTILFDLPDPFDNLLFTPNIDSVRINNIINYCNNIQFTGLGFTNTYPLAASGWQWYFGDGGSSTLQNPIHNYNAVSNYDVKLIVTDINGCKDSIIKTINTAGSMLAEAGRDTSFCVTGVKIFTLNGSGTGTYLWMPAAILNNNTLQNPTATTNATTKFYLTVSNGTGCSAIDSVTVTINQNPIVKTLKDTTICKNALLVLTTGGAENYNWNPGIYVSDSTIANPNYTDINPHTLIVTGTDMNGCKANDTITVDVKNRTTFITPERKTICRGTSVQLNGNNGNAFQYVWSPVLYLSNPVVEKPVANPPFTTVYTLKVSDNICKNDSNFLIPVTVLSAPTVKATKSNDLNCNKPFAQLNASGATTYTWLPAYAINNDSIANPIANPAITTTYYVYGKDSTICAGIDSIKVIADFKNHGFILPNSFTPNNDGLNDYFGIKYYRDITDLEFIIFNRYGGIVFITNNANDYWDGNYKGKPAGPGYYVYYIKGKTLCGNVEIKDNVLLLR